MLMMATCLMRPSMLTASSSFSLLMPIPCVFLMMGSFTASGFLCFTSMFCVAVPCSFVCKSYAASAGASVASAS